jgi:hypothetical protein
MPPSNESGQLFRSLPSAKPGSHSTVPAMIKINATDLDVRTRSYDKKGSLNSNFKINNSPCIPKCITACAPTPPSPTLFLLAYFKQWVSTKIVKKSYTLIFAFSTTDFKTYIHSYAAQY